MNAHIVKISSFIFSLTILTMVNNIGFSQNQSFQRSSKVAYKVSGIVFKAKNRKPIRDAKISTYRVIKEVDTGETIFISELTSTPIYYTSSNGEFSFELDADQEYLIEISAEGYLGREYNMKKQNVNDGQKIAIEIPLISGNPSNIEGIILDKTTKTPIGNATVDLINITNKSTKSIITEKDGKFVFSIEDKLNYEILVQKNQYFEGRLAFKKESDGSVYKEILIEKVKTGEQIELDTFLFSVNSDKIDEDNIKAIKKIEEVLKSNPNLMIEIGCHSDSRGDDQYNLELSQRRANTIVTYLVDKGIDMNRLVPKGYGETQILNECMNGVKCSSEKHQINRRIVVTVIGVIE